MNSMAKAALWNGVCQDLVQSLFLKSRGTCYIHRVSSKHKLTLQKNHYEERNPGFVNDCAQTDETPVSVNVTDSWDVPGQVPHKEKGHCVHRMTTKCETSVRSRTSQERLQQKLLSHSDHPSLPGGPSPSAPMCSSENPVSSDSGVSDSGSDGACWEVAAGGRPPIAWDPDVAAECERSTLLSAPRPPPAVPERQRVADAAAAAELRRLAGEGRLAAALRAAAALTAAGTPPPFPTLALLAEEAARRADPAAFERARRLAARLYPLNYGRAARLRGPQLELLWRRRLFAPACGLLLRYRSEPVRRQQMARRFAVCCCLAAHEGAEDALPYIQSTSVALMSRGLSGPLLSAWQHCTLSDQHSFQEAGRRLLLAQPAARRHLAPYLLHALQEAQLTGREDVLRGLLELMLRLGETRFYPLVFGALLDFQCLMEDVQSARETFKLVGELSISLPSTVINRYSSLLQRHRLKAPAALLRMKYRQRPPDGSSAAAPKVPPAPSWFDDW